MAWTVTLRDAPSRANGKWDIALIPANDSRIVALVTSLKAGWVASYFGGV